MVGKLHYKGVHKSEILDKNNSDNEQIVFTHNILEKLIYMAVEICEAKNELTVAC